MNHSVFSWILLSGVLFAGSASFSYQMQEKVPVVAIMAGPELSEKLEGAVENRLLSPLRKKDHIRQRMFSRCPSGYDMQFNETDYANGAMDIKPAVDGLYYGKIVYYKACDGEDICEYRVNGETFAVEARNKVSEEFVPARQWLEAFHYDKTGAL